MKAFSRGPRDSFLHKCHLMYLFEGLHGIQIFRYAFQLGFRIFIFGFVWRESESYVSPDNV